MMKLILAILLLWIPFSLAALVAIPTLLVALLMQNESVWRPLGKAMDKVLAVLCGYDGEHTLSAELYYAPEDTLLRRFLEWIVPNHCRDSAEAEKYQK